MGATRQDDMDVPEFRTAPRLAARQRMRVGCEAQLQYESRNALPGSISPVTKTAIFQGFYGGRCPIEPASSSLLVPHPSLRSVLACPVIRPFCSISARAEHVSCPLRTEPYDPGCSMVAVRSLF